MANGYLGKISAIVSANTADFDGKLSKSAKEVSSFARSVQSNLTSASRQAARSLEGIYTPLQKFERSLQAAASMKLSFKGFPGMIKDLDGLQQRLNSVLSQRQVGIVLKTTGMSSVSALRDAIEGLKSKDIELIARVGGIDKLKELGGKIEADVDIGKSRERLATLTAAAEAAKAKVTAIGSGAVTVKVNAESVDSLRAKLEATQAAAGKLMGGEYMGQKSLNKAISRVSGELVNVQAELARAVAAQKTLETMASGPRSKPEELSRANDRVSSLTGQRDERAKSLADLEKHRDDVRKVMREIKQAEAGGGAAAGGGDIAAARKEEAAAIRAVSRAAKELQSQIAAKYGVDIDLSDLDQLISRGGKASDVLERLPALMDELGRSDLEAASNKMRQLVSVSEELSDPIKAAQATLTGLAKEVQAGFLPALVQSQSELESLNALIEEGIAPTAAIKKNFDQVKASVDATVASVRQLAEVSEKAGRLKTGRELVFAQPALSESLDRGAAVGNKAAGLPASAISSSPRLVASLVTINQLTREAEAAFAKLQMKANVGLPIGSSQRSLDLLVAKLNEAQSVAEKEIKVSLDTAEGQRKLDDLAERARTRSFTLRPDATQQRDLGLFGTPATRGAEEAIGRARQLSAEFEKLPDAAKRSISGLAQIAGRLSNDLQAGKADASALNQVLDRLEASVRSLAAAEQQRDAATQARQRVLAAEIAQNDRLITQERELAAARQAEMAASRQQESGSLDAAEQALIGPRRLQERPLNEVYGGLGQQAQEFRGAVESTFGLPQFDEFRDQARRAGAEIQSIKSEIQRLSTLDPQRDAAEYADAWGRVGTRVRAVSDLMAAGTRLAQTAAGGAPPEPPEIIDRNQDRLGVSSPMDRNAANIGARTSLGGQGARTDISDMGRMSSLEDRRRDLARQAVGEDIEAPRRQLATLASGITSLKSQIDGLPDGIRTRFVPAIREAENEFIRLSAAPNALPGAIDAARQRVQQLSADAARATQAMNFSQSFGGAGAAGLNLGLDQRALQGYNAQLQVLQGAIGRASAEARGPAIAAFERLRNAVATAFDEGNLDSAENRRRLAALRAEAIAAAAAVSGVRVGTLTRDVSRAGDVGRAGFDRFGLALNQAGYAIDDFMSSTGGLEFKLRAVSNNITQLAFILGGTTGLFVGLGAVIAGQAAVALIKFMNSGRSAEDQTKALNDALAKQKSLVDGLAESHKALADAILRGTTSGSSESSRQIAAGQADLRRQSAELSAERKAAADTAPLAPQSISRMIGEFFEPRQRRNEFQGVAELRAELNKLQKQLESATTVGERSTIQGRIRDTRRAELATRGRLASEQTPDATVVQSAIRGSANSSEMASSGTFGDSIAPNDPARNRTGFGRVNSQRAFSDIITLGGASLLGINRTRAVQQNAANEGLRGVAAQVPTSVQGQIEALRRAQELKRPEQAQADLGFIRTGAALDADREIAKFEAMIQSLQKVMESGIVDSAAKTYAASVDAANSIRAAQEDVAEAIKRGVPSALAFQAELDRLASELASADDELRTAVTANPDDPNVTPEARESAIKRAQERVEGVNRQRADVESRAREVRLGRTFGGERTTRALSSLEGNDRFANEQAGMIASLKRSVDDEVQARRKASEAAAREAAIVDLIAKKRTEVANSGGDINKRQIAEADIKAAEADLEKAKAAREAASAASGLAQAASEVNAAFAEAAIAIESTLARIRKVGDSALQRSEQGADAAQKAFEDNPMRGGGRGARDAAEERLINDRARVGYAQAELSNRRSQIQSDPRMVGINSELETITQRRKDLEAKSATRGGLDFAERDELGTAAKREIELIRQRDSVARELTAGEQEQLDVINSRIAAREKELEVSRRRSEESQEFNRVRSQAEGALGEANRRADEAQQRFVNNPTDENKQRRDEAEDNLRKRQAALQKFQDMADAQRKQTEASPEFQQNNKELQQIAERRAQIAANSAGRAMTAAEIGELTEQGGLLDREKELRGKNEGLMQQGLEPFRNGIDEAQRRDALLARADRGRDLGMTDRERFRKEFTEGAGGDINARAKEMRDKGEDPSKFLRQAFQNQMEAVAPMLKGFQDERQNAILQGPSRAALNVSDVSTSQGASELTRLIRGDDSAKDVNLTELRKQSGFLEDIANNIKANNPGVLL